MTNPACDRSRGKLVPLYRCMEWRRLLKRPYYQYEMLCTWLISMFRWFDVCILKLLSFQVRVWCYAEGRWCRSETRNDQCKQGAVFKMANLVGKFWPSHTGNCYTIYPENQSSHVGSLPYPLILNTVLINSTRGRLFLTVYFTINLDLPVFSAIIRQFQMVPHHGLPSSSPMYQSTLCCL